MTAILLPQIRMLLPFLINLAILIHCPATEDLDCTAIQNESTQLADVIIADHQLRQACQLKPHIPSFDPINERPCE